MNQDQRNAFYQNQQAGGSNGYPPQNPGYPYAYGGTPGAGAPVNPYETQGYTGQGMAGQGYDGRGAADPGYSAGGFGPQGYTGQMNAPQNYAAQGYTAPGNPAQGYNAQPNPASGYGAAGYTGQGYAVPGNPAQGYPAQGYGTQSYAAPGNPAQGYGGTGYPPQGYGGQGYPGQYTSQQGQMPYPQMGRQPVSPPAQGGQVPLNGGGYVPQPVPVRRKPFVMNDRLLIAGCGLLLVLFAVGLFVPALAALKWVFVALAAGLIAFLWIRPVTEKNRRLCITIILGALAAVALISALNIGAGRNGTADPQNSGRGNVSSSGSGGQTNGTSGAVVTAAPTAASATATPEPGDESAVTDRLYMFFQYWSVNQTDEMLTLCSPSWQSKTGTPKADLFSILANRTPKDYHFENISGTNDDQSRTITLNTLIDRNNGKEASRYRLNVIMVKESDIWYVDPQSLKTYEAADTPDPNVTPTPAPTEEPKVDGSTVLYYNPDGGSKYHLDPNCKSTHQKYLPFKGHFTYAEINKSQYVKLSPCNVCGAPLRP